MGNGNIIEFLRRVGWNRLRVVCLFVRDAHLHLSLMATRLLQLADVARGLAYLHDEGIIHGDLKGVCSQIPQLALYAPLTYPEGKRAD